MGERSFFSVSFDLINRNEVIPYDLFINLSSSDHKQKFIKVFPEGEEISDNDVVHFKEKYKQLYVPEDQRSQYMKSLVQSENVSDTEAVSFIKDSAIKYLHNVFDPEKEFSTELLQETISGCKDAVENMIDVLDDYNIDTLRALIGSLSGHDFYTYDHSINVSMYCLTVLRALKPTATKMELLHAGLGGLLHDLGKVKISTEILNNADGLTDAQYNVIKTHPDIGLDLILECEGDSFTGIDIKTISRVIHEHHENWDGTGYPNKLKEDEIHLLARVCAIADFFDAITTKRSYNEVVTVSEGIAIMEKTAGKKLDPKVFKVFKNHVEHHEVSSTRELKMADSFDPTIPYAHLPLEEVEQMFEGDDFGKIRLLDKENEQKKK